MIANKMSTLHHDGVRFVGFASDDEGTNYVMLSLADNFDAQDRELGLVGLHIEVNSQANSGYNLVQTVVIDDVGVSLRLNKALELDQQNKVSIEIPPQTPNRTDTLEALRHICRAAAVQIEGA